MVLGELASCDVWCYTYWYDFSMRVFHENYPLIFITDITPQNVLTKIEDKISLKDVEEQGSQDPSIPVTTDGVPVYRSRTTMLELSGVPILTDFGQMRLAEPGNRDWWMPDLYRAPEVLLKLPWGFPVDVWSVGVMVSDRLNRV